jgi:hypothetical protein
MAPPRKKISRDPPAAALRKTAAPSPSKAATAAAHRAATAPRKAPSFPSLSSEAAPPRNPNRVNKKGVQAWLSPEAHRQLRIMAIREDAQVQDLLLEALDLLFASRGEPRIARK